MSYLTGTSAWSTGVTLDTSGAYELSDSIKEDIAQGERDEKLRQERKVEDNFLQEQLKELKALEEQATWGTYLSLTVIVGILGFVGFKAYKHFTK